MKDSSKTNDATPDDAKIYMQIPFDPDKTLELSNAQHESITGNRSLLQAKKELAQDLASCLNAEDTDMGTISAMKDALKIFKSDSPPRLFR